MTVRLVIKDEVNIKLENLPLDARKKLANAFKYENPYARYHPAYKLGRWDGMVSLFGLGGNGYLSQLETILDVLNKLGISVEEVDDLRTTSKISFEPVTDSYWADQGKVWPKGHQQAGQPIMLRDYQVDTINNFLENPQSLQEVATGAGKTMILTALSLVLGGKSDSSLVRSGSDRLVASAQFILPKTIAAISSIAAE